MADEDEIMTPDQWQKLNAEWTHDYGMRHMEDRGVKYEDEVERTLDQAAERSQEARPAPSPGALAEGQGQASREHRRQRTGRGVSM
jgi:hypothetical protein